MGISFGSINTGLPPNIVQQLVDAERIPVKQLEGRKEKTTAQLKLVEDLTAKVREIYTGLGELGNTKGFADLKIDSGDPNIIQGTVDKNSAARGVYMLEVIKLPRKTSVASNGFSDKDKSEVGVGYIKAVDINGNKREIYVDGNNNTLEKLAQLINRSNLGVQASVVQDRSDKDAPWKLVMSGTGIGEDQAVDFPTFYFLDGDQDFFVDQEFPAQNGRVKLDGFEFEIPDTTLKDVIPGVTLDLRGEAPGRAIRIAIKEDREVITGKIKKFVEQVNGVLGFVQTQNKLDKDSDTSKTLGGDSLLRTLETRLRDTLQGANYGTSGSIKFLGQVGIEFTRAGTLAFDEKKFDTAVAKDLEGVSEFFVGDNSITGLIPKVRRMLNDMLDGSYGPLSQRTQGLKTKIQQFDTQIENKERNLAQHEMQLKQKFSRLEETMAKLKSQGQYLQQRFGGGGDGGAFNLQQA